MYEAKDIKLLGFSKDGEFLGGYSENNPASWHDSMGTEYRKCARCGKFYPSAAYPLSKKTGKPAKCCPTCLEYMEKTQLKRKGGTEKAVAENAAVTEDCKPSDAPEEEKSTDLSKIPPSVLIEELKRRGFKGKLTVNMEFEL